MERGRGEEREEGGDGGRGWREGGMERGRRERGRLRNIQLTINRERDEGEAK